MSPSLRIGLALLVSLVVFSLLPTPEDPLTQVDPASSRYRPPMTELQEVELRDGRRLLADSVALTGGVLSLERRGARQEIPVTEVLNWENGEIQDRRFYILGSDKFGRDIMSRMMVGGRISLSIGVLSVLLAISVGTAIGTASALSGERVDNLLMRGVDAFLAFPSMFLVIGVAALLGPGTRQVILLLGLTSWMSTCRIARGELLTLRQQDFVLASRCAGQSPARIALRHMLPNAFSPLVVDATLMVGSIILAEAALSFFGLGVQAPTPSWGTMIDDGREVLVSAWWVALFPGIAIALTVIGFNLVGEGLRDRFDPKTGGGPSAPAATNAEDHLPC